MVCWYAHLQLLLFSSAFVTVGPPELISSPGFVVKPWLPPSSLRLLLCSRRRGEEEEGCISPRNTQLFVHQLKCTKCKSPAGLLFGVCCPTLCPDLEWDSISLASPTPLVNPFSTATRQELGEEGRGGSFKTLNAFNLSKPTRPSSQQAHSPAATRERLLPLPWIRGVHSLYSDMTGSIVCKTFKLLQDCCSYE